MNIQNALRFKWVHYATPSSDHVQLPFPNSIFNQYFLLFLGAMLGVNMAVNSLIRTVSPTIGGYMLNSLGFSSFGYLGFLNSLLVAVFLVLRVKE